jgi:hypothetical protein
MNSSDVHATQNTPLGFIRADLKITEAFMPRRQQRVASLTVLDSRTRSLGRQPTRGLGTFKAGVGQSYDMSSLRRRMV